MRLTAGHLEQRRNENGEVMTVAHPATRSRLSQRADGSARRLIWRQLDVKMGRHSAVANLL